MRTRNGGHTAATALTLFRNLARPPGASQFPAFVDHAPVWTLKLRFKGIQPPNPNDMFFSHLVGAREGLQNTRYAALLPRALAGSVIPMLAI